MKRKVRIVILILLSLVIVKLLSERIINPIVIHQYKQGQYWETPSKILTYLNFPKSYVANYNYGNILYQKGDYEKAIAEYEKALNRNIPHKKECPIRMNTALAICQTVQVDEESPNSIQEAIEKYETAIDILTQKRCANRGNNDGHNANAQQLKNDIQQEIDYLKSLQQNEENQDDTKEDEQENKKEKEVNTVEAEIREIKEKATMTQREMEKTYQDYNKEMNYYNKNW